MTKYKIEITQKEEYIKNVWIEADSHSKAIKKAEEKYENKDIALLTNTFNGMEKSYKVDKRDDGKRRKK
jgi:hypothetical protein